MSYHDAAGIDADPHVEIEPVVAMHLFAVRLDAFDDVGAGEDRALRIVLVRDRLAEQGEDRVADELVDRPF